MLKIWSLWVKELQSYQSSNFENDSTPGELEFDWFEKGRYRAADFFLRYTSLKASNFEALYIYSIERSIPSKETCLKSKG